MISVIETPPAIILRGERYFYNVNYTAPCATTSFFKEYKVVTKKKYGWFGKKYDAIEPLEIFFVTYDITSPHYSKQELSHLLEKALSWTIDRNVKLSKREEEIRRGELV